jgi:NAD+ synthase (glutamine-hydrolysing)
MKVFIAQLEVIPNDPQANTKKIIAAIDQAEKDGAKLAVFSEMAIPGYLIGDNWERPSFIEECVDCQKEIVDSTKDKNVTVVFGNIFPDNSHGRKNEDGRMRKYNAAITCRNGVVARIQVKCLQPNYREFDDNRHFYDGRKLMHDEQSPGVNWLQFDSFCTSAWSPVFSPILCEDGWDSDYTFKPMSQCGKGVVINLSCSPYTNGKNGKRNRVFSNNARKYQTPIIYVNCVGIQNNGKNIFAFDGGSCAYDRNGHILNFFEPFEEKCQTFDIDFEDDFGTEIGVLAKDSSMDDFPTDITQKFDKESSFYKNCGFLYKSILYGTTKFMSQLGVKKIVIGASGGIDSCLAAAIYSKIVGKENLLLVNMPSQYNSKTTIGIAEKLAMNIGCKYISIPIEESVELTKRQIPGLSEFALQNVQARDRSSRVLAACVSAFENEEPKGLTVFTCNGNKSELSVGYCTMLGDLSGFLAILGDLWKSQVYGVARYFNDNVEDIIPEEAFSVKPSAELSVTHNVDEGKGDPINYPYHDKLFASWIERWDRATPEDNLSWYMDGTFNEKIGLKNLSVYDIFKSPREFINDLERWWNLHAGFSVAKRIVGPPLISLSRRSYGYDMRESQLVPWYSLKYKKMKEEALKE